MERIEAEDAINRLREKMQGSIKYQMARNLLRLKEQKEDKLAAEAAANDYFNDMERKLGWIMMEDRVKKERQEAEEAKL